MIFLTILIIQQEPLHPNGMNAASTPQMTQQQYPSENDAWAGPISAPEWMDILSLTNVMLLLRLVVLCLCLCCFLCAGCGDPSKHHCQHACNVINVSMCTWPCRNDNAARELHKLDKSCRITRKVTIITCVLRDSGQCVFVLEGMPTQIGHNT